jgi:hypothetical protein
VGHSITRATVVWFVGAAVVGAAAGILHLFRSAFGGGNSALGLAVATFALTLVAAAMLYRGIIVAAAEQDAAAARRMEQSSSE